MKPDDADDAFMARELSTLTDEELAHLATGILHYSHFEFCRTAEDRWHLYADDDTLLAHFKGAATVREIWNFAAAASGDESPMRAQERHVFTPFLCLAIISGDHAKMPPVPKETHGPGLCGYCGQHARHLKEEPRSLRSYCRKCAPVRETDADWPPDKASPTNS